MSFKTFYIFKSHQPLRFEIYYVDSKNDTLKKHDFIGYAETSVQYLVNNLDQEFGNCFNLRGQISIPKSVKKLGTNSFNFCSLLASFPHTAQP